MTSIVIFDDVLSYMTRLLFQQLFEKETSTFTYLIADADTRQAVIIDPVIEMVERDLRLIREMDLRLTHILETHIHADHVTGAGKIADQTGAKICISEGAETDCADIRLQDGDVVMMGAFQIRAIACPGHTASCMCFFVDAKLFSGDALLIRGNGRTDFQEGSPELLYKNIHEKIFTLPEDTVVYPAHDYKGLTSSTIGLEKKFNARLGGGKTVAEFVEIMDNLNLAPPAKIDRAVPANLKCGRV